MELFSEYLKTIRFTSELKEKCRINLLEIDDISVLKDNQNENFKLHLKISIEYDKLYDKIYIGPWFNVCKEYRQMFTVLSFLKESIGY